MNDPEPRPGLHPDAPEPPTGSEVVDWITAATRRDRTIVSAIPPCFARYATVVIPVDDRRRTLADAALVGILQAHTAEQPWWLGYLDTGVAELVDPTAPTVSVYVGWPYRLLAGDPQRALTSRSNGDSTPWHSALPELLFPSDRSWLVSTMWDDDWRCVGGPVEIVDALLAHPHLEARAVLPDDDATPPGHEEL